MNVTDKSALHECTSCQLCGAVCSKEAIHIELNPNGFYRPIINKDLCIDCGICTKVCYKFDTEIKQTQPKELQSKPLYAAWAKDDDIVRQTTSGGIGDLLAHRLIADGYKVLGVVYNDKEVRAEHSIAATQDEIIPFRGSKYIQSYTLEAMKEVVKHCKQERYAVFGTPCQIYALNKWAEMKHARDNFLFIDLYCHGCPSLHAWTKYQTYIKHKLKIDRFDKVEFRSKVKGWGTFYVVVVVGGKPIFVSNPKEDGFYELFFCDQVLNDGCHECQLRGSLEYTDIRLGDFWGKKYLHNHRGVSGVSLATKRGADIFEKIFHQIEFERCDYTAFLPYQSWVKVYHPNPSVRTTILESLRDNKQTIDDAVKTFRKHQSFKGRIKRRVKNLLYYLPTGVTGFLKRIVIG